MRFQINFHWRIRVYIILACFLMGALFSWVIYPLSSGSAKADCNYDDYLKPFYDYYINYPHTAQADENDSNIHNQDIPLKPIENTVCFMSAQYCDDVEDIGSWCGCHIDQGENGYWMLHAVASDDVKTKCQASCIFWQVP